MQTHHLDLNLLQLLLEIEETGSVSKAGRRLGLSQPAASNALARLRCALDDPLFVRGREGMVPTAYVERVAPALRAQLSALHATLADRKVFDPATSTRAFQISLSDLGEQIFLPPLARRVAEIAPHVTLENIAAPMSDLARSLTDQMADVAIGILTPGDRAIRKQPLFTEVYRAVASMGLSPQEIAEMNLRERRIILVAPTATYAEDMEALLDSQGYTPNISYRLRSFGALPEMLRLPDAVAILPGQFADRLTGAGLAQLLPVELPLGQHEVSLVWHRRSDDDPGCAWLRGIITELFADPAR